MIISGYLRYTDISEKRKDVHYPGIDEMGFLLQLRDLLRPFSYADITKAAITHSESWYPVGVENGQLGLHVQAKLQYLNRSTYRRGMLTIPAPRYELFEPVMKKGYRIPDEIGKPIIEGYGIIINQDLRFISGWLTGATKP